MDWKKLDDKITTSERYKFFQKHQRLFIFLEGLFVIGLLFGIVLYTIQDREIKQQIRDHCGYTTDTYDCICEPNLVENWKALKRGGKVMLNISEYPNVQLDR